MMDLARNLLYEAEPIEEGEHKLFKLNDGNEWSAMIQGSWDTDMIWLDPANEECFESLLTVLRKGGFDTVLDKVGKAFDLNSLMIQGIGKMRRRQRDFIAGHLRILYLSLFSKILQFHPQSYSPMLGAIFLTKNEGNDNMHIDLGK